MTPKTKSKQNRIYKQKLFLVSLRDKLIEFDDPNPSIITHDSYEYIVKNISGIGRIPAIRFFPYGRTVKIKADIMRSANIHDHKLEKEIDEIRAKYTPKVAKDKESRILARRFESYWNSYWRGVRTAINRIEQAQKLFITSKSETISKPMQILMGNKLNMIHKNNQTNQDNQTNQNNQNQKTKSYADELMEVD